MPGYSVNLFAVAPGKRFECPICFEVLKDPKVVCQNGHSFCSTCMVPSIVKCPTCRESISSKINNIVVRDIIENLVVKCNTDSDRCCSWTGPLSTRNDHLLKHCQLVKVHCLNKDCNVRIPRRDLRRHMRECDLTLVPCSTCKGNFARKDMQGHTPICPKRVICCENSCGAAFEFQALSQHRSLCPEAMVRCPLHMIGKCQGTCTGLIARRRQEKHVNQNYANVSRVMLIYDNLYQQTVIQLLTLPFAGNEENEDSARKCSSILMRMLQRCKLNENWEGIKIIHNQLKTVGAGGDVYHYALNIAKATEHLWRCAPDKFVEFSVRETKDTKELEITVENGCFVFVSSPPAGIDSTQYTVGTRLSINISELGTCEELMISLVFTSSGQKLILK